jgi:hypothetical protein
MVVADHDDNGLGKPRIPHFRCRYQKLASEGIKLARRKGWGLGGVCLNLGRRLRAQGAQGRGEEEDGQYRPKRITAHRHHCSFPTTIK